MGVFNTGNPTLTEKIFDKSLNETSKAFGVMTVRGTLNKFGFLLLMMMGSAMYIWSIFTPETQSTANTLLFVGAIGGFILAIVMMFKPNLASYIAPAYAILEGLFIGGISAYFNAIFSVKYPNIILHAVGLTFGVALAMFLLYNFRIINVTNRLRSIIMSATLGIALFYAIVWILSLFGVNMGFGPNDGSLLSIGISLFIVGIAAFNLLLDFDAIENAAEMGAPKFMEWYSAFGLLVTMVWLYLEILKLLSKLNSRN
jgi:uncharacterized YccA/Bax inhibitor family protein